MANQNEAILSEIFSVLSRETPLRALPALIQSMESDVQDLQIQQSAIGIDASAFLRIASHPKGEDLIDYFGTSHEGPIILPGQAIQEFWNNELNAVQTVSKILSGSLKRFKKELDELDEEFEELTQSIEDSLGKFEGEHGHIYSKETVRKTLSLLNTLNDKAVVPFAPRLQFHPLAEQRQRTKTPPGFMDAGDGDFYVWIDFLYGIRNAQINGDNFNRAILITNDTKLDWGRSGSPHPILSAEAQALVGVPFVTWSLQKFAEEVTAATE